MRACYAGSFDPFTFGHLDVARRALDVFEHLTLAIGSSAGKSPLFTVEERLAMIREETSGFSPRIDVMAFEGLLVDACAARGIRTLVRGVRTIADFELEMAMSHTNRRLGGGMDTVIFFPSEEFAFLSSRLIKEVARGGGCLDSFVPPSIARALAGKLAGG